MIFRLIREWGRLLVPALPGIRAGLRGSLREARGRGLREGQRGRAARAGGMVPDPLHSDADGLPRRWTRSWPRPRRSTWTRSVARCGPSRRRPGTARVARRPRP